MTYSDAPTTAYVETWPFYLTDRVSPTLPRRGDTQPRPVSTSLGRTGHSSSRSPLLGGDASGTYVTTATCVGKHGERT